MTTIPEKTNLLEGLKTQSAVLEKIGVKTAIIAPDMSIIQLSPALQMIFLGTEQKNCHKLFAPDPSDQPCLKCPFHDGTETKKVIRYKNHIYEKTYFPILNQTNETVLVIATFVDITTQTIALETCQKEVTRLKHQIEMLEKEIAYQQAPA